MFANGPKAIGLCDRCGQEYLRKDLKYERNDTGKRTKMLVCNECNDPPHPQANPYNFMMGPEAIAIRDPRPDPSIAEVRNLYGYDPVPGLQITTFPRYNP